MKDWEHKQTQAGARLVKEKSEGVDAHTDTCRQAHRLSTPCRQALRGGDRYPDFLSHQKMRPLSVSRYRKRQKLEHHTTRHRAAAARSASSSARLGREGPSRAPPPPPAPLRGG